MFETKKIQGDIKYKCIHEDLRNKILTGKISSGTLLQPERQLMQMYDVSRHTVREALSKLESEGFIVREQGRGTRVKMPVPQASSQKKNGLREIGLITAGLDESFTLQCVCGVEQEIRKAGFQLLLANCEDGEGSNLPQILGLLQKGVCGLIIFPLHSFIQKRSYQFLEQTGVPFVFVDNRVPGVDADCVTTDNYIGAYEGTKALIAAGARKIAYLSAPFSAWTSRERLSGCQKALWEAGMELDRELIFDDIRDNFGYDTVKSLLDRKVGVDGLFIANHPMTRDVLRLFDERDDETVSQIKICSFDAPDTSSRLISVRQPMGEIGIKAANLLMERIEEHSEDSPRIEGRNIMLSPEVVTWNKEMEKK